MMMKSSVHYNGESGITVEPQLNEANRTSIKRDINFKQDYPLKLDHLFLIGSWMSSMDFVASPVWSGFTVIPE